MSFSSQWLLIISVNQIFKNMYYIFYKQKVDRFVWPVHCLEYQISKRRRILQSFPINKNRQYFVVPHYSPIFVWQHHFILISISDHPLFVLIYTLLWYTLTILTICWEEWIGPWKKSIKTYIIRFWLNWPFWNWFLLISHFLFSFV